MLADNSVIGNSATKDWDRYVPGCHAASSLSGPDNTKSTRTVKSTRPRPTIAPLVHTISDPSAILRDTQTVQRYG
jgi:hypothetical protein